MNFLRRVLFKSIIRNIFESQGLMKDNSKVKTLLFQDGFIIKNIKIKKTRDELEEYVLSLINDQPKALYNSILVNRDSVEIRNKDYFSNRKYPVTKSDLRNIVAQGYNFKEELLSSNCGLITGGSGTGKTTLLKFIRGEFASDHEIMTYSLKAEEFPEGECKGFEQENLLELLTFLKTMRDNRQLTFEKKRLLIIDEFFFLGKISGHGEEIVQVVSELLPWIRTSSLKIIVLSQTLNKQKSKNFDLDLVNLKLINLHEIRLFLDSLGHIPEKFLQFHLKKGQFIKLSIQEEPLIISYRI